MAQEPEMPRDPDDDKPFWELPGKEEESSVLGYAAAGLIIFVVGAGLLIYGMIESRGFLMLLGAILIAAGGGLAALLGERLVREITGSQGGGAARRARRDGR